MSLVGLTNDELLDLVKTTRAARPFGGIRHTQKYQSYPLLDAIFQQDRIQVQGGTQIEELISLSDSGAAEMIRPSQERTWKGVDVLEEMNVPWVDMETHWVTTRDEILKHTSNVAEGSTIGARLVNLIENKRAVALMSMANLFEERIWEVPEAESNPLHMAGIPYWVPKNNSGISAGDVEFVGGSEQAPGNLVGGINPATHERWKSACGQYQDWETNRDEALDVMRLMYKKLRFRPPALVQGADNPSPQFRIYAGMELTNKIENAIDQKNDSVRGNTDLGWQEGQAVFKRMPIIDVPLLDEDTDDPIYFINHAYLHPYFMQGAAFREQATLNPEERYDTYITPVHNKFNIVVDNRRANGVMSTA